MLKTIVKIICDGCGKDDAEIVSTLAEQAWLFSAAPELLKALKEEHGYDDVLHLRAQPDCWKCAVIAKAEGREMVSSRTALGMRRE